MKSDGRCSRNRERRQIEQPNANRSESSANGFFTSTDGHDQVNGDERQSRGEYEFYELADLQSLGRQNEERCPEHYVGLCFACRDENQERRGNQQRAPSREPAAGRRAK